MIQYIFMQSSVATYSMHITGCTLVERLDVASTSTNAVRSGWTASEAGRRIVWTQPPVSRRYAKSSPSPLFPVWVQ